ncbi:hypothetical protein BMF94_1006 [Rhodotorula taiwanensis]|uniref:Glutamine amidotransferase domain-containing protein n=1 Tax=Rhodotorula taiwanensis TaxID=741276 RepID=A0A2S5BGN3_9BASI|nr:hypothetical protein BMF94_1006 [Rhodotorula taiwanensis]
MTVAPHPADRTTVLDLPSTATRDLLLLVLLADTPIDAVRDEFGTYHDIFASTFQHSIELAAVEKGITQEEDAEYKLTIESYDTKNGDFPKEERVKQADGLLITGSASSAHDDEPWIVTLVDYIQRLPSLNPDLRTIGICFGQQTISRAYGTMPGPNEKGWEIGVHNIELTEHGRKVFAGRTQLNIHQMHRDNVPSVPEGFELLGSTDKCPVHGIVKYRDGVSPADATLEDVRIVALQGHPEFNSKIVNEVIAMRESKGVISKEVADESRENADQHDDGQYIGRVFLRMFGL